MGDWGSVLGEGFDDDTAEGDEVCHSAASFGE